MVEGRPGNGDGQLSVPVICVTGRFQPFHCDHLDLVLYALARADVVVIGVTNPDDVARVPHPASAHRHLPDANPWTYPQREVLIRAALARAAVSDSRYRITPFPLDEPAAWPGILPPGTPQLVRVYSDWEREKLRRFTAAGYPPLVLDGDPRSRITASDIRNAMRTGGAWRHLVPPGARELLASWVEAAA